MNEKVVGCESQMQRTNRKMNLKSDVCRVEIGLAESVDLSAQVRISVDVIDCVTTDVNRDDCNVNLSDLADTS